VPTNKFDKEGPSRMTGKLVRYQRALLVSGPTLDEIERSVRKFPLFHGGAERALISMSAACSAWFLIGVPRPIPKKLLWELSLHLRTGLSPVGLIAVQYIPDHPEKTYYLTPTGIAEWREGSPMRGRRDDGRGVVLDFDAEVLRTTPDAKDFELGTEDYLSVRGVPATLLPTSRGFQIVPTVLVDVQVDAE
jgi:hypothetical protein